MRGTERQIGLLHPQQSNLNQALAMLDTITSPRRFAHWHWHLRVQSQSAQQWRLTTRIPSSQGSIFTTQRQCGENMRGRHMGLCMVSDSKALPRATILEVIQHSKQLPRLWRWLRLRLLRVPAKHSPISLGPLTRSTILLRVSYRTVDSIRLSESKQGLQTRFARLFDLRQALDSKYRSGTMKNTYN